MFDTAEDDELEAALMLPDPHLAAKRAARETVGDDQGLGKRRRTEEAGGPSAVDATHQPKQLGVCASPDARAAVGTEPPAQRIVDRAASAQAALRSVPAAAEVFDAHAGAGKRKAASGPAASAAQSDVKRPRRQSLPHRPQAVTEGGADDVPAGSPAPAATCGGGSGRDRASSAGGNAAAGDELRHEAEMAADQDRVSASPDTPPDGQRRPSQETSAVPAHPAALAMQSGDTAAHTAAPEPSGLPSTGAGLRIPSLLLARHPLFLCGIPEQIRHGSRCNNVKQGSTQMQGCVAGLALLLASLTWCAFAQSRSLQMPRPARHPRPFRRRHCPPQMQVCWLLLGQAATGTGSPQEFSGQPSRARRQQCCL